MNNEKEKTGVHPDEHVTSSQDTPTKPQTNPVEFGVGAVAPPKEKVKATASLFTGTNLIIVAAIFFLGVFLGVLIGSAIKSNPAPVPADTEKVEEKFTNGESQEFKHEEPSDSAISKEPDVEVEEPTKTTVNAITAVDHSGDANVECFKVFTDPDGKDYDSNYAVPMPTVAGMQWCNYEVLHSAKDSDPTTSFPDVTPGAKEYWLPTTLVMAMGITPSGVDETDTTGAEALYSYAVNSLHPKSEWRLRGILPLKDRSVGILDNYTALICIPMYKAGVDGYTLIFIEGYETEPILFDDLMRLYGVDSETTSYNAEMYEMNREHEVYFEERLHFNTSDIIFNAEEANLAETPLKIDTVNGFVTSQLNDEEVTDYPVSYTTTTELAYQHFYKGRSEAIVSYAAVGDDLPGTIAELWEKMHPGMSFSQNHNGSSYVFTNDYTVIRAPAGESSLFGEVDKPYYLEFILNCGQYYKSVAVRFDLNDDPGLVDARQCFAAYGIAVDPNFMMVSDEWCYNLD